MQKLLQLHLDEILEQPDQIKFNLINKSNIKKIQTFAPHFEFLSVQKPIKTGSPSLTNILSTP